MRTFFRELLRFRGSRAANVSVIFSLAALPIISSVGIAVDYSRANALRAKLLSAADAASVGSIGKKSPAYLAAGTMTGSGAIAAGKTDAEKIFNGNIANASGFTLNSVDASVTKTGNTISSNVEFTATISTMFLGVIGKNLMTITGNSKATVDLPVYIDFYLLLDNSPSMGVGATPSDVALMVKNTSDKCAFACHDNKDSKNYYNLAKKLGVTMRIDVLRSATQQLMDTAAGSSVFANQYRMAIYDFGEDSITMGLRQLFALSSSLSSAKTAANNIDLMAVYGQPDIYTGDANTTFTSIFPAIGNLISAPGPGTAESPQKYLFFVSDGVADEANSGCLKAKTGTRCQSPINTALCTAIKNRGINIAVLYTTYLELPTNAWYNQWIAPFNKGPFGPSPNSEVAQKMQACASPGFYFEVSPTDGIADAMKALFLKAINTPRISS